MTEAVRELTKSPNSTVVTQLEQPGIGVVISSRSPIRTHGAYTEPRPAPRLGENTEEVLTEVLGLGSLEVARLYDRGIVGGTK